MLEGLHVPAPATPGTMPAAGQAGRAQPDLDALFGASPSASGGFMQQPNTAALLASGPGPQAPVFGSSGQELPPLGGLPITMQTMDLMGKRELILSWQF